MPTTPKNGGIIITKDQSPTLYDLKQGLKK
jgi:hypothetical protein